MGGGGGGEGDYGRTIYDDTPAFSGFEFGEGRGAAVGDVTAV